MRAMWRGRGRGVGPEIEEVELDPSVPSDVQKAALEAQSRYSQMGLVLGVIVVVGGVVLTALGYSGSVSIAFEDGTRKAKLVTGSLGVVIALIGLAVVWFTRFVF